MRRHALAWVGTAVACMAVNAVPAKGGLPAHAGTRLLRSGNLTVEVADPDSSACRWNKGLRFSPVASVLRRVRRPRVPLLAGRRRGPELHRRSTHGVRYRPGGLSARPARVQRGAQRRTLPEDRRRHPQARQQSVRLHQELPGRRAVRTATTWQGDRVHFVQTLAGNAQGYRCELEVDLIVKNDRLIMRTVLRNTGTKRFTTEQYIHNFVCFSDRSVGPNVTLSFPYTFTASPSVAPWSPPTRVRGVLAAAAPEIVRIADTILYVQKVASPPKIWITKPQGYTGADLVVAEHLDTGQRLTIEASIPSVYTGIWTTDYQVSPEQFLLMTLAPGEQREFTRTYTFCADGLVPEDATGDGKVDANDLAILSSAWLSTPLSAGWLPAADVYATTPETVDLYDFTALASRWRQEGGLAWPVAHWKLDERAGSAAFDACGGHDGTLIHFATDGSQWVTGEVGGGLDFDGTDDLVEVVAYPGITGQRPRSITAWVKLGLRPGVNETVVAWGTTEAGRYWHLDVDKNRRLRLSCGTGFIVGSGRSVGETQWRHVAAVLSPVAGNSPRVSDVRLYVDGQAQTIYDLSDSPIDTAEESSLRIGASQDPDDPRFFYGVIDDVRIYDSALSMADIRRIGEGPGLR